MPFCVPVLALCHLTSAIIDWPMSRAERSLYTETSRYSDVIDFFEGMQKAGAPVGIQYIGTSTEGKRMPLVIVSRPMVGTPTEARAAGKAVVYIQANIHAGEVEGKEAVQHLIRKYCQEPRGVLDKLVIVATPIYNIDGNEKFGPQSRHRPGQNGPEQVGLRANGQGLDLNRDHIKAETPEFRAVLDHVYTTWDPDVMLDLHTTDGTRHGYGLTYAPPLNPSTVDSVETYARDVMLPGIRKQLRAKFGVETFDYGNVETRGSQRAWYEVGQEGRYSTNYVGLRNRIGILSEALVYRTFKDRVLLTERFTDAVIQWTASRAKEFVNRSKKADQTVASWGRDPQSAPEIGVRFDWKSRGVEPILLEKQSAKAEGIPTDLELVRMEVFDRFVPTRTSKFPAAYLVPASESETIKLLMRHGVKVEKFVQPCSVKAEVFQVTKWEEGQQPFQGHKLQRLEGSYQSEVVSMVAGDFMVRTSQPLGVLVFHILEPESLDGAAAWGFLGPSHPEGRPFKVSKVMKPVVAVTEVVD